MFYEVKKHKFLDLAMFSKNIEKFHGYFLDSSWTLIACSSGPTIIFHFLCPKIHKIKVWVATVFCIARTHLARPDLGSHAHMCALQFFGGRTSHPHPHL